MVTWHFRALERMSMLVFAASSLIVGSAGCSSESSDASEPSTESSGPAPTSETNDETQPDVPATCELTEDTSHPEVTLTGRICGEDVTVTTRAGAVIHLGRSRATDPETEIRVIEVLPEAPTNATVDLATEQFLVNLAFETGPEVISGESEHELSSGVFSLCGFGTVVLMSGPATFEIAGVEAGARAGDIEVKLTGLLVAGFSPQHGQSKVNACGGEVDLTLRGAFVHQ